MLVKFELMLAKCQINTNTDQNGFLILKIFREDIKVLIICFNYFKLLSFEQKLLHLPSIYRLTHSLADTLICPHNALKNLKVEKFYSG